MPPPPRRSQSAPTAPAAPAASFADQSSYLVQVLYPSTTAEAAEPTTPALGMGTTPHQWPSFFHPSDRSLETLSAYELMLLNHQAELATSNAGMLSEAEDASHWAFNTTAPPSTGYFHGGGEFNATPEFEMPLQQQGGDMLSFVMTGAADPMVSAIPMDSRKPASTASHHLSWGSTTTASVVGSLTSASPMASPRTASMPPDVFLFSNMDLLRETPAALPDTQPLTAKKRKWTVPQGDAQTMQHDLAEWSTQPDGPFSSQSQCHPSATTTTICLPVAGFSLDAHSAADDIAADDDDMDDMSATTAYQRSATGVQKRRRASTNTTSVPAPNNHNAIERRYRNNLNTRIAELRSVIPAFSQPRAGETTTESSDDDVGISTDLDATYRKSTAGSRRLSSVSSMRGTAAAIHRTAGSRRPAPAAKQNKGTVLSKAVEHIQYVSRKSERRRLELLLLRSYIKSIVVGNGGDGSDADVVLRAAKHESCRRSNEIWAAKENTRIARLDVELKSQRVVGSGAAPSNDATTPPPDREARSRISSVTSSDEPSNSTGSTSPTSHAGSRLPGRIAIGAFMCLAVFYHPSGEHSNTRGLSSMPGLGLYARDLAGAASASATLLSTAHAWGAIRILAFLLCLAYLIGVAPALITGKADMKKQSMEQSTSPRSRSRCSSKSRSNRPRPVRSDLTYTGYSCTSMIAACWDLAVSTMFHMTGPKTPHLLRHAVRLMRPMAIPTNDLLDVIVRLDAGDADDDATRARVLLRAAVVLRLGIPIERLAKWAAERCWAGAVYAAEYAGHDPLLWPLRDPAARENLCNFSWLSRDGLRLRGVVGGDPWPVANALLERAARLELRDRIGAALDTILSDTERGTAGVMAEMVRAMDTVVEVLRDLPMANDDIKASAYVVRAIAAYRGGMHEKFTECLKRVLESSLCANKSTSGVILTAVGLAFVPEARGSAEILAMKAVGYLLDESATDMEMVALANVLLDVCLELEPSKAVGAAVPDLVRWLRKACLAGGVMEVYDVPLKVLYQRLVFIGGSVDGEEAMAGEAATVNACGDVPAWGWTRYLPMPR